MTTSKEQLVLRERLQAVEDDLLAAGKRHVIILGAEGVFEWHVIGGEEEPVEESQADDVQEIEDQIVAESLPGLTIETAQGVFSWKPLP